MIDDAIVDAFLRHRLRLDGLAQWAAAEILSDILKALETVQTDLERAATEGRGTLRLSMLTHELSGLRFALEEAVTGRVDAALSAILDTMPGLMREVAGHLEAGGIAVRLVNVPLEMLRQTLTEPFDGHSWQAWGARLADDTVSRVHSEARQSLALGEGIQPLRRRLERTTGLAKASAERLARTCVNDVANRASVVSLEQGFGDLITGWKFVATLDGRTSLQCASLDGTVWAKDDPNLRRPPLHPNCRSTLVPITDLTDTMPPGARPFVSDTRRRDERERDFRADAKERVGADDWKRMTEAQRRAEIRTERQRWQSENVGQVSGNLDFTSWLERQDESFQREYLGPARFEAYQRGLPLASMTSYHRPLSVTELRQFYQQYF